MEQRVGALLLTIMVDDPARSPQRIGNPMAEVDLGFSPLVKLRLRYAIYRTWHSAGLAAFRANPEGNGGETRAS